MTFIYHLGNENIVRMLIEKGADVNHKDKKNEFTPLIWAAHNSNFYSIKIETKFKL